MKRTSEFVNQPFSERGIVWFINMRWYAAACVIAGVILSQYIFRLLPEEVISPLWVGVGMLLFSNFYYWSIKHKIYDTRRFILSQMILDLFILTYLIHFSGGIENPLLILYAFHIMIAGVLLSRREAYIISIVTSIFLLCLALSEYLKILPHYTFKIFPHPLQHEETIHASHNLFFVLGVSSAFVLLLFGTAYFTTTIMEQLRLNNQRLINAEKLAVMGQITAYIAHEVNNPIAVISTKVKLILSSKNTEIPVKIKDTLDVIDKYCDRIAGVVRGLLNLVRPHQTSPMSSININRVISESLVFVEARLRQANIELEKVLDWTLPAISGRFYEMGQVIVNIVNNAIDAMPNGGKIRMETYKSSRKEIRITISDTGHGIPEENLNKIFAPFFSTKSDKKGTGLGLSMCQAVIRAHGGEIEVESRAGCGTKFIITLSVSGKARS